MAGNLHPGDVSALLYLWNPMTILTCVSSSTTPFENLIVIVTLYGASRSNDPFPVAEVNFFHFLCLKFQLRLILPLMTFKVRNENLCIHKKKMKEAHAKVLSVRPYNFL